MSRLIFVLPYYSIESWTFQHFDRLRTFVRGNEQQIVDDWERDRASLDEVLKPKEKLSVGSTKNKELATCERYPGQRVYDAGTSFSSFVDHLAQSPTTARLMSR